MARYAAPLRRIERVTEFGVGGARNKVLLDCGHEVRSDATYRARCCKCATPTGQHP